MMLIIIVAVLMLAIGGGGCCAGQDGRDRRRRPRSRKTIRPADQERAGRPFAQERGRQGRRRRRQEVEGDGAAPKTSYYTFTDDFTSNLKQSTAGQESALPAPPTATGAC
jgi:flagellar FliL protein